MRVTWLCPGPYDEPAAQPPEDRPRTGDRPDRSTATRPVHEDKEADDD